MCLFKYHFFLFFFLEQSCWFLGGLGEIWMWICFQILGFKFSRLFHFCCMYHGFSVDLSSWAQTFWWWRPLTLLLLFLLKSTKLYLLKCKYYLFLPAPPSLSCKRFLWGQEHLEWCLFCFFFFLFFFFKVFPFYFSFLSSRVVNRGGAAPDSAELRALFYVLKNIW